MTEIKVYSISHDGIILIAHFKLRIILGLSIGNVPDKR